MKILVITQYFKPESFRINDLSYGLMEMGHEVSVLTGLPNYPTGKIYEGYGFSSIGRQVIDGVEIIRCPVIPRFSGKRYQLFLNYMSFAFCATIAALINLKSRYDIIFVYEPSPITVGIPARILKYLNKTPIIFWVQDLWPDSLTATGAITNTYIIYLIKHLVTYIYRGCDRILVQSRAFIEPIKQLNLVEPAIDYFPNSAEEFYKPVIVNEADNETSLMPKGFNVLFAGNIGVAQDFETILSAAEILKSYENINWVILGDGRLTDWLNKQIEYRGLTDVFILLGLYPPDTMPRFFSLADVLLVTLRREPIFSLTIPSKIQSYLACGKPIIAAIDGEGARIVNEANAGIAVDAENPQALASSVLKLKNMDKEDRESMGQNGRKYFEKNFERKKLLEQLDYWLRETITSKHK